MSRIAYAGIGSRSTPSPVLDLMKKIAYACAMRGYILRSGAAQGADAAFEAGCDEVQGTKEIYLPWKRFNDHKSPFIGASDAAFDIAAKYHPNWHNLSGPVMNLHARNVHQILGRNLNDPVARVICWTPNASGSGGTGQALRIAQAYRIPIHDLGDSKMRYYYEQELSRVSR